MTGTSNYVTCLDREIHYMEWGAGNPETVVMWHGLARTGRDFDDIARELAGRYRVLCPDTIGRGLSQWSPEPDKEYGLEFYGRLAHDFVDRLGVGPMRWVGTSMGGAIGMVAAAGPLKQRITHLVLNDIGPTLAEPAVARIRTYAGAPARFATMTELERYFRTVYQPFGSLSADQWRRLTETSYRRTEDGMVTPHYDPQITRQFIQHPDDYDLWSFYEAITAPTLCLRGERSDLLLPEVAEAMTRRGPRCRLEVIAGCGHAPALNTPEQIALVSDFLGA